MSKAFILGLVVGITLIIVGGVAGFYSPQQSTKSEEIRREQELFKIEVVDATPIQLGILTPQQKIHSNLYSHYRQLRDMATEYKNISDLFTNPKGKVMETVITVGLEWGDETPNQYFNRLLNQSDAIIRGQAIEKVSQITEDDSFIFTDYKIVLTEIIKNNSQSNLEIRADITVTRPGGKILINDTVIKAVDEKFQPLPTNRELLLFLKFIPETQTYQTVVAEGAFEIEHENLTPLTKGFIPEEITLKKDLFLQIIKSRSKQETK